MAKFTRTAYVEGTSRDIAQRIANQSGVSTDTLFGVFSHKAAGRKRVRITITVEPEKAPPARPRGPRKPRPVQQALPLEVGPPCGQAPCPRGQCCSSPNCRATTNEPQALIGDGKETLFRMPLYGADGGMT